MDPNLIRELDDNYERRVKVLIEEKRIGYIVTGQILWYDRNTENTAGQAVAEAAASTKSEAMGHATQFFTRGQFGNEPFAKAPPLPSPDVEADPPTDELRTSDEDDGA